MKIAWFCIPAHGHINPTLALVREMTTAGHEVYYFSFSPFRSKIEEAGGHFISCDGYDLGMDPAANGGAVGTDLALATELLVSATLALDEMVMQLVNKVKPDVIVSDSVAYWGKLAALKYGIPYVSSTTTFAFNRYSSRYIKHGPGQAVGLFLSMPKIGRQLKRLRDHGYPVKSILDIIQNDNDTNTIVYTSKYFQPCAETFSDRYCFVGPSIRPIQRPMEKTASKTVFVSLGTVVKNSKLLTHCIQALGETNYQVIVALGESRPSLDALPDNIQVYGFVDQMAALAVSDVFITHCGMNSASEGLYFEVPLILCPQTPEQAAVAKRVEELGAGVTPRSSEKADILAAVNQVLEHPEYKKAVGTISDSFQKSGGAEAARAFLESLV